MDVRRVGLGPPRFGRGDPSPRAPQAAARGDHPAARRRWLRSGRRPAPHCGRPPCDHRGCPVCGLHVPAARGAGRMKSRAGRWIGWLLALVGVGLALKFSTGFPWQVTFAALLDADRWLLIIALAVNLSSLVAKGWGWHLLLKPVAPHSWRVAQEANLVGAAVNDLSVAVAGEAARVHLIAQRGGVPAGAAVSSVVWTRVAEGLALALFLVMAPSVLVALAASVTALVVVNLGGLLRPTPANVGVTQAALVVGLLPFGVAPEQAVAAGLALQALQVLPVLFLGAMVTGWRLLKLESELA